MQGAGRQSVHLDQLQPLSAQAPEILPRAEKQSGLTRAKVTLESFSSSVQAAGECRAQGMSPPLGVRQHTTGPPAAAAGKAMGIQRGHPALLTAPPTLPSKQNSPPCLLLHWLKSGCETPACPSPLLSSKCKEYLPPRPTKRKICYFVTNLRLDVFNLQDTSQRPDEEEPASGTAQTTSLGRS